MEKKVSSPGNIKCLYESPKGDRGRAGGVPRREYVPKSILLNSLSRPIRSLRDWRVCSALIRPREKGFCHWECVHGCVLTSLLFLSPFLLKEKCRGEAEGGWNTGVSSPSTSLHTNV
ncbi:hypothetical protein HNY73_000136 [Argiope bruennichi]|uniref:Uncharacterized protein n=1 Tax=Argiope bruennichi TaxID=94029 RepID=A0A8T0FX19_ARGBR|nr:hypothetical protein HNY73_000136 [Argiope bruennichi]